MPFSKLLDCFGRSQPWENSHITFMPGESPIYGRKKPVEKEVKPKGKVAKFFLGIRRRFIRLFRKQVSTPEGYLTTDVERDVEIQASNQPDIDWTDSFRRIYKEVALEIGDIYWTGALLKLFSEPKDFIDDSCDFNLTEPLTTMFGDVYEVVDIPSFNAARKSASDSVLFEATEEFSHGEIRSDAKQSKSFDQIQDWKMDLAVGIPDIQIVDRELGSGSRQSKNMEFVSYGQSVASSMSVVDIF